MTDQLRFRVGHGLVAVDLEDGQDEDLGSVQVQDGVVAAQHL